MPSRRKNPPRDADGEIIEGEVAGKKVDDEAPKTFSEAMGRAARRGVSSTVYWPTKNHFLYRAASKSIATPLAELFAMLRGVKRNVENFTIEQQDELFLDVRLEVLDHWIHNAQRAFVIFSFFVLLGSMIVAWGTTRAGFTGFSTMIGGILTIAYAASMGLRASRDVEIFRTRQPLPFTKFVEQIDELWCPLPVGHPWRTTVRYLFLPGACVVFLGALVYAIVT